MNNTETEWRNKIATATWKVGGNSKVRETPAVTYQNEIINPVTTNTTDSNTEYAAKIGLMYISDYGFAAAPTYWTYPIYSSNASSSYKVAVTSNWIYMGLEEWTITRYSDYDDGTNYIHEDGSIYLESVFTDGLMINTLGFAIRPTFYLLPSVVYSGGTGTQSNPIRLEV